VDTQPAQKPFPAEIKPPVVPVGVQCPAVSRWHCKKTGAILHFAP
jgi:hypothetical protein